LQRLRTDQNRVEKVIHSGTMSYIHFPPVRRAGGAVVICFGYLGRAIIGVGLGFAGAIGNRDGW
jgi:hypothetical protein